MNPWINELAMRTRTAWQSRVEIGSEANPKVRGEQRGKQRMAAK